MHDVRGVPEIWGGIVPGTTSSRDVVTIVCDRLLLKRLHAKKRITHTGVI